MILRAEVSALVCLCVEKKLFTVKEYEKALDAEAEYLSTAYQRKFPGARATDTGMNLNAALWVDTTKGWKP